MVNGQWFIVSYDSANKQKQGRIQGGDDWGDRPSKTYTKATFSP